LAPEYYDRAIRDDAHYTSVVDYIAMNPVRAKLCAKLEDWRFSLRSAGAAAAFPGASDSGRPFYSRGAGTIAPLAPSSSEGEGEGLGAF
jgi:hypothetical protein